MRVEIHHGRLKPGLQGNWEEVYDADPQAHFFLSWAWINGYVQNAKDGCVLLALRPDAPDAAYVAFFPLRYREVEAAGSGSLRELAMAGNRTADYTGLIALPEYRAYAGAAFAVAAERNLEWDSIHLENVFGDCLGVKSFVAKLLKDDFKVVRRRVRDNGDGVDHSICPYIALPARHDDYLARCLGRNTRRKARRYLERLDGATDLSITRSNPETFPRDIRVLQTFWREKWQVIKGEKTETILTTVSAMLHWCLQQDILHLDILWHDDEPLGVIANLVDRKKNALLFLIGGRHPRWSDPPPGYLLHLNAIKNGIEEGFTLYDFLRGNESYKYLLGATDTLDGGHRKIDYMVVSRH